MAGHGHLFVMHGDMTRLAADDYVVPCDGRRNVTRGFAELLGGHEPGDRGSWIRPLQSVTAKGVKGLWRIPTPSTAPRVWLLDTTEGDDGVPGLTARLRAALLVVSRHRAEALNRRARRLIALPLVGIGEGGFADRHAETLSALLRTLTDVTDPEGAPDLALVLLERSDYAVIQQRRVKQTLASREAATVRHLASAARTGQLVLFLGAGVSAAAGLPSWTDLISRLLRSSSIPASEHASILRLPAPDAADCLTAALGRVSLAEALRAQLPSGRHALAHGLLASLRVHEVVTTNFDSLFELAADVPYDGRLVVLPFQRLSEPGPWLLKLHGDVDHPDSIVLTREHYLKFDSAAAPLASIVQAGMVTKHLLFCGYSLSDDNFIRLARQVRELFLRADSRTAKVGTVLTLFPDRGRERLWSRDVDFLAAVDAPGGGEGEAPEDATAESARRMEILLDALAHRSCSEASYVLDEKYYALLSPREKRLARALRGIDSAAVRGNGPAEVAVRALIRDLGGSVL